VSVLGRLHAAVLDQGWFVASAGALGLPDERDVIGALSPALADDPRGPGKMHARDVIGYGTDAGVWRECDSIAHGGVNDFSRFELADGPPCTRLLPGGVLGMVPPQLRKRSGRMSADYFRYSPGTASAAHQDGFGDLVVIWTLDRNGDGAESFLLGPDGRDVMRGPLAAGSVLVFRDELFLHGVTPLKSGHRDALIFITLKDGA